ncbi:hypothetical protein U1Q18_002910 [Sarracenia purpurea var. burkii]
MSGAGAGEAERRWSHKSSSLLPLLLSSTRTSESERMPMCPWRASTGERNPDRIPRETRVYEIFRATKPDFPMPEKKMVPLEFKRV